MVKLRHFLTIIIVSALAGLSLSAKDQKSIEELHKTVNDGSYGNYWDRIGAIKNLGKFNNKDAAVILGGLLDDGEAPIREGAVMALGAMTDKASIEWLAAVPLANPKSPRMRLHAAWALSLIKDPSTLVNLINSINDPDDAVQVKVIEAIGCLPDNSDAADYLIKKLSVPVPEVRAAAALCLGRMKAQSGLPVLLKKVNDPHWTVKAAVLEALTQISPEEAFPYLLSGLKSTQPQIRIAALESLAQIPVDKGTILKTVAELFSDKVPAVRATAIRVSRKSHDCKYIPYLIDRLKDAQWQLRYDIIAALSDITGASDKYSITGWMSWYEANKDRIESLAGAPLFEVNPDETIPTFFTIPVMGRNIIFVIDFSGSMKNESGGKDSSTKADIALKELEAALSKLNSTACFNIIIMSTEATRMNKRRTGSVMLAATDANKKLGIDFARSIWDRLEDIRRGRGDLYDAVTEAMKEPDVDTIFILSDGKPTYGTYIVDENIIANLEKQNRFRKITMNTVMIGEKGNNPELMRKIADVTGGVFIRK
ncbi:MAG: HEAT repeat domain-containing protein [Candidatus Brocadiia bacterium]